MFSSLLRKSGSLANIGGSPDKDGSHSTPYGDVISEVVVEPEEIKQSERNLNDIKQLLSDLIKAQRAWTEKGDKLAKTHVLWAQSFSKDHEKNVQTSSSNSHITSQYAIQQQAEGGGSENNIGFTRAMEQFTVSMTKSSNFDTEFVTSVNEGFIKPIQTLISVIEEKKVYRKKYDKASNEYETLIGKIKTIQTKKVEQSHILKLYTYEREKTKAKLNFDAAKHEYITYLNDTQNRMHTEFIEILIRHYESMSTTAGNSYSEYAGIKSYVDSLRTWCLSEQDYFLKDIVEREQKRAVELSNELDAKFQPFIDLLTTPAFNLWYGFAEVRKNELYPPPPPPGGQPVLPATNPINFIPHLVRVLDMRGQMSELLSHMVRSDLVNQHASSLGNVFINQPIWCEMVEECAVHLAIPYLKYLFDQSITTIVGYPERFRPHTPEGIQSFIGEFQNILTNFATSQQYLPPPFKRASMEIDAVKREKSVQHPPSGCLLFARVFAPFIARPHLRGLFNVVPSDGALESLGFFATMFSHAGTNQTFLASQTDYQQLNEALASARPKIIDFFGNIGDTTEWASSVELIETYYADIPIVQAFAKQHYSNVANTMSTRGERELAQTFLSALGQLEANEDFDKGHSKKASQSVNGVISSPMVISPPLSPVDEAQQQQHSQEE
ncbi:RasGTPase-activating protein [Cavenderia fasciculata]|uniref:RasGTPase-activating protein n=1 Tax=Cavenderia fasciculata TaxID=261658 RepID=F4PK80_CACFS|nr:RasGTPase-activating protein [Cavenderia fasciculata]EGG24004.1 RasGTPase-activating protein [Cavenderia fasciculata]|eukprot:XP_004361855.1 RasGTPase-activating protein [Cavenderia fasciculata]